MKRILLALGIAAASLVSFNSCTKEYITNNYSNSYTFVYTVDPGDWTEHVDGHVFHTIDLPELTEYFLLDGFVSAAMSADGESSYDILPSTYNFSNGDETNPIAFSVNYSIGKVTIYGQDPVNEFSIPRPNQSVVFKITLSESTYVE